MKGVTIGVPAAFYVDDLEAEVARVLDRTIAVLKREGAAIAEVELPEPVPAPTIAESDVGEVLGLLGESGSGKSVTLRALMRLLPKRRPMCGSAPTGSRDASLPAQVRAVLVLR